MSKQIAKFLQFYQEEKKDTVNWLKLLKTDDTGRQKVGLKRITKINVKILILNERIDFIVNQLKQVV